MIRHCTLPLWTTRFFFKMCLLDKVQEEMERWSNLGFMAHNYKEFWNSFSFFFPKMTVNVSVLVFCGKYTLVWGWGWQEELRLLRAFCLSITLPFKQGEVVGVGGWELLKPDLQSSNRQDPGPLDPESVCGLVGQRVGPGANCQVQIPALPLASMVMWLSVLHGIFVLL
jgi:hypothetical protein